MMAAASLQATVRLWLARARTAISRLLRPSRRGCSPVLTPPLAPRRNRKGLLLPRRRDD